MLDSRGSYSKRKVGWPGNRTLNPGCAAHFTGMRPGRRSGSDALRDVACGAGRVRIVRFGAHVRRSPDLRRHFGGVATTVKLDFDA